MMLINWLTCISTAQLDGIYLYLNESECLICFYNTPIAAIYTQGIYTLA